MLGGGPQRSSSCEERSEAGRYSFRQGSGLASTAASGGSFRNLQTVVAANPNSIDLLANLTTLSIALKDTDRAKEMAERLLKIQPESRVALEGLAAAALSRGDFGAAAQHCSQLIKVAGET